jgi:hypothetical protein
VDRRGGNRIVVGFTTTCEISAIHHKNCDFDIFEILLNLNQTIIIKRKFKQ